MNWFILVVVCKALTCREFPVNQVYVTKDECKKALIEVNTEIHSEREPWKNLIAAAQCRRSK